VSVARACPKVLVAVALFAGAAGPLGAQRAPVLQQVKVRHPY
jgi:hypothetical protein